uniref:hypothetical protein n=1 Tax=Parerythrobacter lutipelagi TaxID=1964208 RepID=UPI0010F535F1|nr:hypothetical protein [Parerythrobacter lutipelagi]
MYIPPRDEFGMRRTVNYGLSTAQTVWNLRAALNVAALNCQSAAHVDILPAYSLLLERDKRALSGINNTITSEFRAEYGRDYRSNFDNYMTQVYNYYALPPTQRNFCDTALAISREYMLTDGAQLETFAIGALPRIERVFQNFYSSYEQYQRDVSAWDAEYAPPPPVLVQSYPETSTTSLTTAAPGTVYDVQVAPSSSAIGEGPVAPATTTYGATYEQGYTTPSSEPVIVSRLPASDPVIVSQMPSAGSDVIFSPGVAEPASDQTMSQAGASTTLPGFSLTDPVPPTDTSGTPIVFESGEIVQDASSPDRTED